MFDVFEGKPRQAVTATPVVISIVGHIVLVGLVVVHPAAVCDGRPAEGADDGGVRRGDARRRAATPTAATARRPRSRPNRHNPGSCQRARTPAPMEAPSEIRPELPGIATHGWCGRRR